MNVALFLLLRAGSAAVVKIDWQLPYPNSATHDFEVNSDDEIVLLRGEHARAFCLAPKRVETF